jgi:hypothetical protein
VKSLKDNLSTIGILVIALFVCLVGLYTENQGFLLAGAIFFVVGIVLVVNGRRAEK